MLKETSEKGMLTIVGIGGTTKPNSSTEIALEIAMAAAQSSGAHIDMFDGSFLVGLPHYGTPEAATSERGRALVKAVRAADGLIIASPGYHGSISGLVKNAIDYLEETARDSRAYLDGLPVGLIATAYGWQATGSTMAALRAIAHALRGWPTPLGATVRSGTGCFEGTRCTDPTTQNQLESVGKQVVQFARAARGSGSAIQTES